VAKFDAAEFDFTITPIQDWIGSNIVASKEKINNNSKWPF
jgi:hypothetical protein